MKKTKIFESKINEGIKDNIKNTIANKGYGEVLASIDKSINDFKHSGYTFLEISDALNQFYNIGDSKINDYIKSKGYNIKDVVNEDGNNLSLNDFKIGEKVNYNGSDMYIRTLDTEKGVGLSDDKTGFITVGVMPDRFLELVKKIDNPVNEVTGFTPQQIADIITNTNSKMVEVTVDQLTPQMVEKFNIGYDALLAKYPDYDPYNDDFDGEDYQMNLQLSDEIVNAIADSMIYNLPSIFEDDEPVNENQYIKKKPNGKWGIISAKDGKFWDADYETQKDAEDGFKAYQANKHE